MIIALALRRTPSMETFLDEIKKELAFDNVRRYLRFPTEVKGGVDFKHIVNTGVYPVMTGRGQIVHEGDTLCRRNDFEFKKVTAEHLECPGCTAIAQTLAVVGTEAL
jgi:hypothetical protein